MLKKFITLTLFLIRTLKPHPKFQKEHGLIKITQQNYKNVLKTSKRTVIFFYDSECLTEHCKHSLFNYIEASHKAIKHDLHQVSRIIHYALCDFSQVRVRKFRKILENHDDDIPSVYLFANTHPIRYNGFMDIRPLSRYFKHLMVTKIERTQQRDKIFEFMRDEKPALVYFGEDRNSRLYSYFTTSTSEFHDIIHIHADTSKEYINQGYFPKKRITLHTNYGEEHEFFTKGNYDDFRTFVNTHRFKPMTRLKTFHVRAMISEEIPAVVLVCVHESKCGNYIKTVNNTMISQKYRKRLMSFWVRKNDLDMGKIGFKLDHREIPYLAIVEFRRKNRHVYYMDQKFTYGNLKEWIGDWLDMRSHHEMISEISTEHGDIFIKKIVGHNFEREILDKKKPAVLLVHNGIQEEIDVKNEFINTVANIKGFSKEYVFGHVNQRKNNIHLRHYLNPTLVYFPEHKKKKFNVFEHTIELITEEEENKSRVHINKKIILNFLKSAQKELKTEIPLVRRLEDHLKSLEEVEMDL